MQKLKTLTVNGRQYAVEDPDSVSYGESQALTEQQAAQARENIRAVGESEMLDLLVAFCIAPVLLDGDGAILAEKDSTILMNM